MIFILFQGQFNDGTVNKNGIHATGVMDQSRYSVVI